MPAATIARCLEILRCPITGQPLSILSPVELAECNQRIAARALLHRDGTAARTPLTFALGTPRRSEIYRIEDSIIWLLSDLALVNAGAVQTAALIAERKAVQSFYDDFGWVKADGAAFNDTVQNTDTRDFARDYQRHCNARIARELPGGKYLLDVASGAIPHTEYLEFSRHYEVRICVDFSIRALREAQAKLGDSGLYLLGDITRLPLAAEAIDEVISLHTIYHVPQTEQTTAIDELVRVTKPGGRAVVVYIWARSAAMDWAFALRRELGRIRHALWRERRPPVSAPATTAEAPPLYFAPQNYDWFVRDVASRHAAKLKVWSGVSIMFQAHFFSARGFGRFTLAVVKWWEDWFPWLAGRFGQYPMFVIRKPR
jgi:ubiquinone/menaquinone biosynthesis C-methylase UbiE/uncharacterized protein YbaR (Trm112 family)